MSKPNTNTNTKFKNGAALYAAINKEESETSYYTRSANVEEQKQAVLRSYNLSVSSKKADECVMSVGCGRRLKRQIDRFVAGPDTDLRLRRTMNRYMGYEAVVSEVRTAVNEGQEVVATLKIAILPRPAEEVADLVAKLVRPSVYKETYGTNSVVGFVDEVYRVLEDAVSEAYYSDLDFLKEDKESDGKEDN